MVGALAVVSAPPLSAWPQTKGKEPSSTSSAPQSRDDKSVEPIPEGAPLPDMPEPEVEAASSTAEQKSSSGARLGPDYRIGPEDVLEIDVFDVPELHKTVRVSNEGTIALALIGRLKAAGLTAEQLREQLETKYGETYLQHPQVTVFITEFHAQPVSVIGAVEKPGVYQLVGRRTLIEMLSMAGGLAKRSSAPAGRTLYVTRQGGFSGLQPGEGMELISPDKVEINIQRLLYSHDDALNIEIRPRDIISVSKADVVYVLGAVKKPGGFVLEDREKVTVTQALAMAEGFTGTPSKRAARIVHRDPDGTRTEIPVDMKKVLEGKSEDIQMAANDILYIPDSPSRVAARRGLEAAISTVSGILIFRPP